MLERYDISKGLMYLRSVDQKIDEICATLPPLRKKFREPSFEGMCRIIISQQLSGAAAETIFKRLLQLAPSGRFDEELALKVEDKKYAQCGVSRAKTIYVKHLAGYILENPNFINNLKKLDADGLQVELKKIKGFGPWSAAIFALFYMQHPNIFTYGDVSVLRAISQLYGTEFSEHEGKLNSLIDRWSPYNSVACMMMWNWIDNLK